MVALVDKFITPFLKNYVFKTLMGDKNYPILGIGKRPKGAKDTSCFITKKMKFQRHMVCRQVTLTSASFFNIFY